jgi:hypothetical protein
MFKTKLIGVNQLKARFTTAAKDINQIVGAEVQAGAADYVSGARRDAPVVQGGLKGAISYYMDGDMQAVIVAQKFYAPFIEFGTKGNYKAIPGTEEIAAQFKGYKGGDFQELLRMIVRWVKRKGISGRYSVKTKKRLGSRIDRLAEDYAAAWPIVMSIIKKGIKPHPYFFKQMEVVWPAMLTRIERRLKESTKISVIMPGELRKPKIV